MVLLIVGSKQSGKRSLLNTLLSNNKTELEFNTLMDNDCITNNTISNDYVTIVPCISLVREMKIRPFFKYVIIIAPSECEWRKEKDDDFYFNYFSLKKEGLLRNEIIIFNNKIIERISADSSLKNEIDLSHLCGDLVIEHRMSFTKYFMKVAHEVSLRSNCIKRTVGAIIVKDNRIISTGYNGAPTTTKNCYEGGCKRCCANVGNNIALEYCVCIHAEENAILNLSIFSCKDTELYTTHFPCLFCARKIIQCQIKSVYYMYSYSKEDCCVEDMFKQSNISVYKVNFD
ncbi:hypothetical protein H312_03046 [Anncaliia algerae PRA339]|uniref:dCMP deaminase n=1 Tax=Anncaliia algerae PRA339 TaxID=1288291 RepID=A0A059EX31_9MICR|nr:hypothetical protein H312_03046 [Anncaliia algerae PRA339]